MTRVIIHNHLPARDDWSPEARKAAAEARSSSNGGGSIAKKPHPKSNSSEWRRQQAQRHGNAAVRARAGGNEEEAKKHEANAKEHEDWLRSDRQNQGRGSGGWMQGNTLRHSR